MASDPVEWDRERDHVLVVVGCLKVETSGGAVRCGRHVDDAVVHWASEAQARDGPCHSGQAGLVTFLMYEPDDLVLVTRVIWTG